MNYYSDPLLQESDRLVSALDARKSREERVVLHKSAFADLGSLVLSNWEADEERVSAGIHASTTLALDPFIGSHIDNIVGDVSVAKATSDNLQYLCRFLMENKVLRNPTKETIGKESELAILGVGWWGIARGVFGQTDYLRMSTHHEDQSDSYGLRNGFDIYGTINGRKRQKIQVKTARRKTLAIYEPGIKMVSPGHLLAGTKPGGRIINALAYNNEALLTEAAEKLKKTISPATKKSKRTIVDPTKYRQKALVEFDV